MERVQLEQQRGPRPSRQVLGGLARALRLNDDERAHLFLLAGEEPEHPATLGAAVRPNVIRMLQRFDDVPALVLDATSQVLAWNDLAAALITDFSALRPADRNLLRLRFLGNTSQRNRFGAADQATRYAQQLVLYTAEPGSTSYRACNCWRWSASRTWAPSPTVTTYRRWCKARPIAPQRSACARRVRGDDEGSGDRGRRSRWLFRWKACRPRA